MGKLVQVNHHLVTTGNETQNITLTGIDTDDVYMFVGDNVTVGATGGILDIQPTVSGTADTDSNINVAWIDLNSTAAFQKFGNAGQNIWRVTDGMGVSPYACNFIMYLYNFNSSSEYSFITMEVSSHNTTRLRGYQQGGVKTETTSFDGVYVTTNQATGGGFQAGSQFTLYKVT